LDEQIKLAEQDWEEAKKLQETGLAPAADVRAKYNQVLKLRLQLAGLDSSGDGPATSGSLSTDEEEKEIRRIRAMIQNSPDLINAPGSDGNTPLHDAAEKAQPTVAGFLLDNGANPNGKNRLDWTPLHKAAAAGHKAMVDLLLGRGANVEAKNNNAETALHQAANRGFKTVAETLIAHKADANARDRGQGTPLQRAAGNGHLELVQLLLSKGADVNASSSGGETALMLAARAGHVMTVNVLLTAKANADAQDENGHTALSFAVGYGHLDVVKALLAAKANPNAGERDLPLATAVFNKQPEIAEALLAGGAEVNRKSLSSGEASPPWNSSSGAAAFPKNARGSFGPYLPLQIAVHNSDVAMVKLLFKFKADANANAPWNNPPSPLIFSTLVNLEMFKAFLEGGANADSVNSSEDPLINVAARTGFAQTEMLLARNAKVNVHGYDDATPLHRAVESGDRKTLELLLDHQADPNAKDNQGGTPLHWAIAYARKDLAEVLLTHGADPNIQNKDGRTPLDLAKAQQPGFPGVAAGPPAGVAQLHASRQMASTQEAKTSSSEIAELLRTKGALDDLPNFSGIRITRGMATPQFVFSKGTNSLNRFTLMEALVSFYNQQPHGGVFPGLPQNAMPFPDLKKIRIQRWAGGKPSDKKEIAVNLLTDAGSIDCTKDVPLEFGDVIEIPEREHTLAEPSVGLKAEQYNELFRCTERKIKVVVRSEITEIKIAGDNAYLSQALALREVQNILRSTSDFSRIKLTRADPTTKQTKQIIVPKVPGADDLWLRDGDVIEVPDKP
jgi:ankyrin repeat protein